VLLPIIDWKGLWNARGSRIALISTAVVLVVSGVGTAGYYLWPEPAPKPPPPVSSALIVGAEYALTGDFNRLPMNQRLSWVNTQITKMTEMDDDEFIRTWNQLGHDKRKSIERNLDAVMRERLRRQAQEFQKTTPTDKTAYLDKCLDEFEKIERKVKKAEALNRADPNSAASRLSEQERRRQVQARENADFSREGARFMLSESADQRTKTVSFLAAASKRQVQRHIKEFLGGGRRR
jgi:hypothetical protein